MTLEPLQWVLAGIGALTVGLNKAGLMGAATINVVIMANMFGAMLSTGIVLPMLIIADIVAVIYYRRHADWPVVLKLIPWSLVGVGIGVFVGARISDEVFRRVLAVVVLGSVILLAYSELRGKPFRISDRWWTSAILGLLAGFTTMVGNAAGPIMTLYLLSMGYDKNQFIGSAVWYFFIVNLLKVPLHIFFWGTITWETFQLDLMLAPIIVAGAFIGLWVVKRIKEKPYRAFVLITTALLSLRLLFA